VHIPARQPALSPAVLPSASLFSSGLQRIVAIGGGTGLPVVLEGLCAGLAVSDATAREFVTAIVTVTDNGGSSGRLRATLGVLPPGDVRNCLAAAASADSPFRALLQHRFDGGELEGHALGNLMLAALTQMTGNFPAAVARLADMIGLRASVLPSTHENVQLVAELDSGRLVVGETSIVSSGERVHKLALRPRVAPVPETLRALVNADGIVVGPGSLYSSVLPNLLVDGIAATISGVNAVRIYVANLMTEPGETDRYTLDDHLRAIHEHVGHDLFDYILVNAAPLRGRALDAYAAQGAAPVLLERQLEWAGRAQVIRRDLIEDLHGGKIRHSAPGLAAAIRSLVAAGRPVAPQARTARGEGGRLGR
jgi:uncharacterized cofD-like protein